MLYFFQDVPTGTDTLETHEWVLFSGGRRDKGKSQGLQPHLIREAGWQNKKQFSKGLTLPADSNPLAHLEERKRARAGEGGSCSP